MPYATYKLTYAKRIVLCKLILTFVLKIYLRKLDYFIYNQIHSFLYMNIATLINKHLINIILNVYYPVLSVIF